MKFSTKANLLQIVSSPYTWDDFHPEKSIEEVCFEIYWCSVWFTNLLAEFKPLFVWTRIQHTDSIFCENSKWEVAISCRDSFLCLSSLFDNRENRHYVHTYVYVDDMFVDAC